MKQIAALILLLPALCLSASVVRTLDAPDMNISGLAWGEGKLWALDEVSSNIYGLNPETGVVQVEFFVDESHGTDPVPTGLAFSNEHGALFAGSVAGTRTYIYFYSSSGGYLGYDYLC